MESRLAAGLRLPPIVDEPLLNATLWRVAILIVTAVVAKLAMRSIGGLGRHRRKEWIHAGLDALDAPLLLGLPAAAVITALPATGLEAGLVGSVRHAALIGVIVAVAWLSIAVVGAVRRVVEHRYRMDVADKLAARSINTKVRVLPRVLAQLGGSRNFRRPFGHRR